MDAVAVDARGFYLFGDAAPRESEFTRPPANRRIKERVQEEARPRALAEQPANNKIEFIKWQCSILQEKNIEIICVNVNFDGETLT